MIVFQGRSIQAAIFDMDGTLFDTERLRFNTINQASAELAGAPIGDDILMDSLGLSAKRAEELAQSRHGEHYPYRAIRQRADELELAHVREHGVPVKAGVYEILERLKRNGILLAVATSSRRAIAEEYLINAGVMKYFDITVCGDEVVQGKPAPEIFLAAAAQLNSAPEQSLMVEDSANGLLSASRAGGLPILIRDIKDPPDEVKSLAFRAYVETPEFLAELVEATPCLPPPDIREPFPEACNGLTVGIHGLGAMGGGYLAQILSHWDGYARPREIIGVTGNATLRELINGFGKYMIRYNQLGFDQAIENIRAIDSTDEAAVCQMYADSALVALCLPESSIRQQARLIAQGLLARRHQGGDSAVELTVLVVLNKVGGAAFVRDCVRQALLRHLSGDAVDSILNTTHFVETVANRVVSKLTSEALLRQVRIKFGSFERHTSQPDALLAELVGSQGTLGEGGKTVAAKLNQISRMAKAWEKLTLILFNSGTEMQLYAAKGSPLLERLRQVTPVEDIAAIQTLKNRLLNGPHAIVAWHASVLGYRTIGQGMSDPEVAALADKLIGQEIKPALLAERPDLARHIEEFSEIFLRQCASSFKDPCQRVGRDPLRKLQRHERIFATLDIATRHGIPAPGLAFGAALGLFYAARHPAAEDLECQRIREQLKRGGVAAALSKPVDTYNGKPYAGLDPCADAALIASIEAHFDALDQAQILRPKTTRRSRPYSAQSGAALSSPAVRI